jgi:hypothetical protein
MNKSTAYICIFNMLLCFLFLMTSCSKDDDDAIDLEPLTLDCISFHESNDNKISRLEDRGIELITSLIVKIFVHIDLEINPGVTIAFTNGSGIEISNTGSIKAVGTDTEPIVFTGVDRVKGSWLGLYTRSDDVKNRLENCVIEYAGGGAFSSNGELGNLIITGSTYLRLENVRFLNGAAAGINCPSGNYDLEIVNCEITMCDIPIETNDPNMLVKFKVEPLPVIIPM